MKPCLVIKLLVLFLFAGRLPAATNLLPGLAYFEGAERLVGRFAFQLCRDTREETNTETAAAIYQFDLQNQKLEKVTDSPKGYFIASDDGKMFCVAYCPGEYRPNSSTNVFIYSVHKRKHRVISLNSAPKAIVMVGGHVFFQMGNQETSILNYDFDRDQIRSLEFPDASKWQHWHYDRIHAPRGQTNSFHFYYKGFGTRLGDGRDYQPGFYSLNVASGDIEWFAELIGDKDDVTFVKRTFDGRYIFFDGDNAPIQGFKLVSSPWDHGETEIRDSKGTQVKTLKRFSKLSALSGMYLLNEMSPDGRYALVTFAESASTKASGSRGWANTYYLVDASSGKTRILLKDRVAQETYGFMSPVWWVQSRP